MDLLTLLAFTIAYIVAVLVPGPGVAAIVARALGGGFWSAVPMIVGILVGDGIGGGHGRGKDGKHKDGAEAHGMLRMDGRNLVERRARLKQASRAVRTAGRRSRRHRRIAGS